jgi:ureidoglycolate dehydrogenase (NAD+)
MGVEKAAGGALVSAEELSSFVERVLVFEGVPRADALIVAGCLSFANLSGVDSHGVVRLAHYLRRLANGTINKNPRTSFEKKSQALGVMDGDDGLGHVVTWRACTAAMDLASDCGIGVVSVGNSSHFGMAGFYINRIASNGFLGVVMTGTDALLVPHGSSRPFFGTNPLAIGVPGEHGYVVLDMATTSVPYGKIALAKSEGEKIPPDWGVDENGQPTTDPGRVTGLHPIAGPKGSGLAMMIDIFSNVLAGMPFGPHINKMYGEMDSPRKLGHFVLALDIDRLIPLEGFKSTIGRMTQELTALDPAAGFSDVLYPGQIEARRRERRAAEGIPLDRGLFSELTALGERCGVSFSRI